MTDKAPLSIGERSEAATYIADMTSSLAQIARQHGLGTLSYLLDMAKLEAENVKSLDGPRQ